VFLNMTNDRIKKALEIAIQSGMVDGDHHKMWVIDQMVRALTGCPLVEAQAIDCNGKEYVFEEMGESEEYLALIKAACDGEDGPNTYSWDVGIAP